ncbi:hypothetical protein WG66_006505 [Moniliophthora roreri]|uniref:Uncharacterized protein n=1 Tax=Moniliophthora roreri TaxID=221103 RepID=A0A0W0FT56_MONRR|nr:hypothetical protein WG66_006505 [Moniliophthora roreri]
MVDPRLPISFRLFLLSLLWAGIPRVRAGLRNVSIDDSDPRIVYSPGWVETETSDGQSYGGYYHSSSRSDAFAEFTFTGVGIYYMSPLWPYPVGARLILDDNPSQSAVVDLQDDSTRLISDDDGRGPEIVPTHAIWGVGGLENIKHTLRIEHLNNGEHLVLDCLIYTTEESDSLPTSSASFSLPLTDQSQSSAYPFILVPRSQESDSDSDSNSNTPIIVGAVIGVVLALIGIVIGILLVRYRKRLIARYGKFIGVADEEQLGAHPSSNMAQAPPASPPAKSAYTSGAVLAQSEYSETNGTTTTLATTAAESKPKYGFGRLSIGYLDRKNLQSLPPVPPLPKNVSLLSRKFSTLGPKRQPPPSVNTSDAALKKNNSVKSATSSFFPAPLAEPTPETTPLPGRNEKKNGVEESEGGAIPQEDLDHDLFPKNYSMAQRKLNQHSPSPSSASDTPVSSSPEILGPHVFPRRSTAKSVKSLFAIAEHPSPGLVGDGFLKQTQGSASASASAPHIRKKSVGRLRAEREKQWRKRKLPAIPLSPQGPREQPRRSSRPSFSLSPYIRSPTTERASSESPVSPKSTNTQNTVTQNTAARQFRPLPPSPASPNVSTPTTNPIVTVTSHRNDQLQTNLPPSYSESVASASIKTNAGTVMVNNPSTQSLLPSPPPSGDSHTRPGSMHSIETAHTSDDGLSVYHDSATAGIIADLMRNPRGSIISQPQVERVIFAGFPSASRGSPSTTSQGQLAVARPPPALLIANPSDIATQAQRSTGSKSRHVKQNPSTSSEPSDMGRGATSFQDPTSESRPTHVKQKSAPSVSSESSEQSSFHLQQPPPRLPHSKTAPANIPLRRVKETMADFRMPPGSVPVTPSEQSWYVKSNPPSIMVAKAEKVQTAEGLLMQVSGSDTKAESSTPMSPLSAKRLESSFSTTLPLSLHSSRIQRGARRKPPPALAFKSASEVDQKGTSQTDELPSPNDPSSFPLPPDSPAHTPTPSETPPRPSTPLSPRTAVSSRRRGKVWDEHGRKLPRSQTHSAIPSPLANTFPLNENPS